MPMNGANGGARSLSMIAANPHGEIAECAVYWTGCGGGGEWTWMGGSGSVYVMNVYL